jgi:ribonuclease R
VSRKNKKATTSKKRPDQARRKATGDRRIPRHQRRDDTSGSVTESASRSFKWPDQKPEAGSGNRSADGRNESSGKRGSRSKSGSGRISRSKQDQRTWTGKVSAHPDGFGFVDVEGREKGFFLPHEEMRDLMHGDTVEIRAVFKRGRESAEVIRIVEQASAILVGQFVLQGGIGLVKPRSKKITQTILVTQRDTKGAHENDWVRIEVKRGTSPLRGTVLEVLGDNLTPTKLIDLIVAELELAAQFPDAVLAEAAVFANKVSQQDFKGRMDLRHLPFVTIDGEDARDFDDAICVTPRGEGFEAWVAIADVAHYVHPRCALDKEALERSNSFYFPDRVIPMLPEKLSNGLCSLNPDVPRLAMAVRMRFDANGRRRSIRVYEAVIHSQARLTYTQVAAWLDSHDESAIVKSNVRNMIDDAARLFRKLERMREKRGALDLDMPEVRAVLKKDVVLDIKASDRNIAHRLIEEMMLAANTAVAEFMEAKECALLYRVHAPPEREKIETLNEFLEPFGLFVRLPKAKDKDGNVKPGDVQRVLEQSEGKPFAHVLHRLVLRSMQQARYTPVNEGHFGLAFSSYAHFTSPIRRYADLTVHRRLKALLQGKNPDTVQAADGLAGVGERTSTQERKQQRGEWDTQAMLAALFHSKDIGKTMSARISGLTKRRIFFEFETTMAEGSLSVDELEGAFILDDTGHRLTAGRSGLSYHLGDQLDVVIDSTDPVRGIIHVTLAVSQEHAE